MRYFSETEVRKIMKEVKVNSRSDSQYDSSLQTEERKYPNLNKFESIEIDESRDGLVRILWN